MSTRNFVHVSLLLLMAPGAVTAQSLNRKDAYSREISMNIDNDIFFLIDWYYTAGQDINYRRLVKPTVALHRKFRATASDSAKVIINYQGGFKIFTPRDIDFPETSTMDRPYAGWSYARFSISNFPKPNAMNRYEGEFGLVGKVSGVGQLQRWVHHITDYEIPHGWKSQIADEAVLNLYYSRLQEITFYPDLGIVSQSSVKTGTGGNKLSQDFTFRAFQFNPISNSVFTQSRMNTDTRDQAKMKPIETFVFFGVGADLVLSDIFIQGSLFSGNKSVFTVAPQRVVIRRTYGIMFSSRSISWDITVFHISKEVRKGTGHDYASLGMAVRF